MQLSQFFLIMSSKLSSRRTSHWIKPLDTRYYYFFAYKKRHNLNGVKTAQQDTRHALTVRSSGFICQWVKIGTGRVKSPRAEDRDPCQHSISSRSQCYIQFIRPTSTELAIQCLSYISNTSFIIFLNNEMKVEIVFFDELRGHWNLFLSFFSWWDNGEKVAENEATEHAMSKPARSLLWFRLWNFHIFWVIFS